jgi:hypothetical protein
MGSLCKSPTDKITVAPHASSAKHNISYKSLNGQELAVSDEIRDHSNYGSRWSLK